MTELANKLIEENGPFISGETLWKTLGYPSAAAFRQAKSQGRLDVRVFKLPNRRGNFAFTHEVAEWLQKVAKEVQMQSRLSKNYKLNLTLLKTTRAQRKARLEYEIRNL